MAKPVISYPGAKWRFWPHIRKYIPRDIKDFREPFFGGGSISLSIASICSLFYDFIYKAISSTFTLFSKSITDR